MRTPCTKTFFRMAECHVKPLNKNSSKILNQKMDELTHREVLKVVNRITSSKKSQYTVKMELQMLKREKGNKSSSN